MRRQLCEARQQLERQAAYCTEMGAATCTLLWGATGSEDVVKAMLAAVSGAGGCLSVCLSPSPSAAGRPPDKQVNCAFLAPPATSSRCVSPAGGRVAWQAAEPCGALAAGARTWGQSLGRRRADFLTWLGA